MPFNKATGLYEGFIYCISNDINDKRYIGQTVKTIRERWNEHTWDSSNRFANSNIVLYRAFNKYGIEHFKINMIASVSCINREALEAELDIKEKYYIKLFSTKSPNGYNMTDGGDYAPIPKMTPVYCFDMTGNFIAKYESIAEAERDTGISHGKISAVCTVNGHRRCSAGGFLWSTTDIAPIYNPKSSGTPKRRVLKLSLDNEPLSEYDSLSDAARENGTHCSLINKCCNGIRKSTGGFRWAYLN